MAYVNMMLAAAWGRLASKLFVWPSPSMAWTVLSRAECVMHATGVAAARVTIYSRKVVHGTGLAHMTPGRLAHKTAPEVEVGTLAGVSETCAEHITCLRCRPAALTAGHSGSA
jgi:hypothetical protein